MISPRILFAVIAITPLAAPDLFGQASVNFANTSVNPIRITDATISQAGYFLTSGSVTQILGTASTAFFGIGPASVRVELLAGTTAGTLSAIPVGPFDLNAPYVTNYGGTVSGFQGGVAGGSTLHLPTQPGFDGSVPVFFQFRAWSIGNDNALSYADRLLLGSGFAGTSEIISLTPASGVEVPSIMFGPGPNQWQGLTLYTVVPEPASLALLALGFAVARRKRH